jgi:hypothetical protein
MVECMPSEIIAELPVKAAAKNFAIASIRSTTSDIRMNERDFNFFIFQIKIACHTIRMGAYQI